MGDDTIVAWGKIDPLAFSVPPADVPAPVIAPPPAAQPVAVTAAVAAPAVGGAADAPLVIAPAAPDPVIEADAPPAPPKRAVTPAPALRPPTPPIAPEPARVEPPRVAAPPPAPPPPPPAPPVAAAPPPPAEAPAARVWTPPSARPAPAPAARPSKDDLAALDALLDPRTLEGPLEPLERAPEARWTPPDRSIRARRSGTPTGQRIALIGGFLVVAALGFGGVWYFLNRPAATAARPTPPPATVAAVPVTTVPAAVPSAPAATQPAATLAAATPAPVTATRAPATPAPATAGGVTHARDLRPPGLAGRGRARVRVARAHRARGGGQHPALRGLLAADGAEGGGRRRRAGAVHPARQLQGPRLLPHLLGPLRQRGARLVRRALAARVLPKGGRRPKARDEPRRAPP